MKTFRFIAVLLLTGAVCRAGEDTAYQALRVMGRNNQDILNHVIEVDGTHGDSQPAVWRVLIDDQNARGGVREMEISKGRVISEHTPVRGYAGTGGNAVMDFKRLNLDSQGAFTIANQEAAKRHVGFDSIDYALRADEQSGAPVWILKLVDAGHVVVGTFFIAADSGAVLRTEGFTGRGGQRGTSAYVTPPPPPDAAGAPPASTPAVSDDGNDIPPNERVGYKINRGLHRIGGTLQQFFTGKRTVDKRFDDDQAQQTPPPADRD